jgi:allantoinase
MRICSRRVVAPDGERPACIQIDRGVITRVDDSSAPLAGALDFGDLVISPGLVDTHVHVNEPGRAEWEGFDTATRAAAAGGVTTILDMPLNSVPPTTTVQALEAKRTSARGRCHVDVGFWGGVVPGNQAHLDGLVDAGVRGFKAFLAPSGVEEFPPVDEADLRRALPVLARRDMPLLVHAEAPARLHAWPSIPSDPTHSAYSAYLATRPPDAEVEAIRLIVRLACEFGVRTHIVHVAAGEAVDEIARAQSAGVAVSAETCPHYLTFAAEEIPEGATAFKCAPPIRQRCHQEALWGGLHRGVLDLIVTDHSPAPPSLKCPGDFRRAWGGIASLELSLSVVWSRLADLGRESAVSRGRLARWMSERPAALAGLSRCKGRIAQGFDADLVVWDPDAWQTVDAATLQQRHKSTPYAGRRLRGRIVATFLRGERVWDGCSVRAAARGRLQ